ncbi:hypothetical protein F4861DRAFT_535949 [Xylaria intraflava]|nr:hypothetical protein F4861DRAFT_535949 [Xylaria intraflava]
MPYKLHHWEYDSDSDPGWPRRYLTYDYHTACWPCHEPKGLLRVLQHLFGGPAVRCRHHRNKTGHGDSWGSGVKGIARRKGCKNKKHYALALRAGIDTSSYPDRPGSRSMKHLSRLPDTCEGRTPRKCRPSHTLRFYGCPCTLERHGDGSQEESESESESPDVVDDPCPCRERWAAYQEALQAGHRNEKKRGRKCRWHSAWNTPGYGGTYGYGYDWGNNQNYAYDWGNNQNYAYDWGNNQNYAYDWGNNQNYAYDWGNNEYYAYDPWCFYTEGNQAAPGTSPSSSSSSSPDHFTSYHRIIFVNVRKIHLLG